LAFHFGFVVSSASGFGIEARRGNRFDEEARLAKYFGRGGVDRHD
jgi:hypothetical protein